MKFYVNMLGILIEKLWIQDWCCRFQYNFRSVYCIYLHIWSMSSTIIFGLMMFLVSCISSLRSFKFLFYQSFQNHLCWKLLKNNVVLSRRTYDSSNTLEILKKTMIKYKIKYNLPMAGVWLSARISFEDIAWYYLILSTGVESYQPK